MTDAVGGAGRAVGSAVGAAVGGSGGAGRAVAVRVPATSANLGPGFDTLGLALTLYDDLEVSVAGSGLSIEVTGEGPEFADRGEDNLVVRAMRAAFDHFGVPQPPGLVLRCANRIPHGRGLGSSAAAIVGGVLAAKALTGSDFDVLGLAAEIEGHPDNVAACLSGGLTIAWTAPEGIRSIRVDVSPEIAPVVFIPDVHLSTETARGLLPETVPHKDAAANSGRAALLVTALRDGLEPRILMDATTDWLHQDYRAPALPQAADLVERLRKNGVPAVISGAGPTVLAFTTAYQPDSIGPEVGIGWHERSLNVDLYGAHVRLIGS